MVNKKKSVLIIYKRSPLLAAGTSVAAANERFRKNHACHYAALKKVEAILNDFNIPYRQHLRGTPVNCKEFNIIVSVGGDGTFLHAARQASKEQLIIGVNSDPTWSVGQFCSADSENLSKVLQQTLVKPRVKKLYKLRATFIDEKPRRVVECLNDILVCHANPAAMSRYILSIYQDSEEQRSSGVWISSAAGSSGAIYSAGGARINIEKQVIQYKPREMYFGKQPSSRLKGGLIEPQRAIDITSRMSHGRVFFDGSHIKYPLIFGKTIRIQSSPNYIQMVYA
ncbi:MAG: NAD(+)/NADH kinase [Candidatus Omnitrophica bacterium]|nr:NAD(+)/NADH kinase [Candidatus Omnitrophota bacterium]